MKKTLEERIDDWCKRVAIIIFLIFFWAIIQEQSNQVQVESKHPAIETTVFETFIVADDFETGKYEQKIMSLCNRYGCEIYILLEEEYSSEIYNRAQLFRENTDIVIFMISSKEDIIGVVVAGERTLNMQFVKDCTLRFEEEVSIINRLEILVEEISSQLQEKTFWVNNIVYDSGM